MATAIFKRGRRPPPDPKTNAFASGTLQLVDQLRRDVPGQPTANRFEQATHFKGVIYIAIRAIMDALLSSTCQINKKHRRYAQVSLRRLEKSLDAATFAAVKKALPTPHANSEDEQFRPFDDPDHSLVKLIDQPNRTETFNELLSQLVLQYNLTGSGLLWANPNALGVPGELYVLPTALCQPQPPTPDYPEGWWRVTQYYPSGGFGLLPSAIAGGGAPVDGRDIFQFKNPHPLWRWDAYSPLTACATQLDVLESIDVARWSAMESGLTPDMVLLAPGVQQTQLDAYLERLKQTNIGKRNHRKVMAIGGDQGDSKFDVKFPSGTAKDMDFAAGWDQMTAFALAAFGVPKSVAGLATTGSYAELYAALKQFHTLTLRPLVARLGVWLTKHLARIWGKDLAIQLDLPTIDDQQLQEQQASTKLAHDLWTYNEARSNYGMKPVPGGDVLASVYVQQQQAKAQQAAAPPPGADPNAAPQPGAPAPAAAPDSSPPNGALPQAAPAGGAPQPDASQQADPLASLLGTPTPGGDDQHVQNSVADAALGALGVPQDSPGAQEKGYEPQYLKAPKRPYAPGYGGAPVPKLKRAGSDAVPSRPIKPPAENPTSPTSIKPGTSDTETKAGEADDGATTPPPPKAPAPNPVAPTKPGGTVRPRSAAPQPAPADAPQPPPNQTPAQPAPAPARPSAHRDPFTESTGVRTSFQPVPGREWMVADPAESAAWLAHNNHLQANPGDVGGARAAGSAAYWAHPSAPKGTAPAQPQTAKPGAQPAAAPTQPGRPAPAQPTAAAPVERTPANAGKSGLPVAQPVGSPPAAPASPIPQGMTHDDAAKAVLAGHNFKRMPDGTEIRGGADLKAYLDKGGTLGPDDKLKLKTTALTAAQQNAPRAQPIAPKEQIAATLNAGQLPHADAFKPAAAAVPAETPAAQAVLKNAPNWAATLAARHADKVAAHLGVTQEQAQKLLTHAISSVALHAAQKSAATGQPVQPVNGTLPVGPGQSLNVKFHPRTTAALQIVNDMAEHIAGGNELTPQQAAEFTGSLDHLPPDAVTRVANSMKTRLTVGEQRMVNKLLKHAAEAAPKPEALGQENPAEAAAQQPSSPNAPAPAHSNLPRAIAQTAAGVAAGALGAGQDALAAQPSTAPDTQPAQPAITATAPLHPAPGAERLPPNAAQADVLWEHAAATAPPNMDKKAAKAFVESLPPPSSLPDKPEDYFKVHEADKVVPLSQIKNLRARPEGIENAGKFMEASRRGIMPKRAPLNVVNNGDGTFTVADGNSTFANAKNSNWKSLPVKIVPLSALHDEQRKTIDKEHARAVGKFAGDKIFTPEELALPKKGVQSAHNTKDELYAAAQAEKPAFDRILDAGEGVEKALGATAVNPANDAEFQAALAKPGPVVLVGGIKGEKRAAEKVGADYGGNWNQLHDILRGTVAVDNASEVPKAMAALKGELAKKGWKLAKQPKNRFAKPTLEGYSDFLLNVVGPGGVVSEVQVHLKPMLQAKAKAHKLYETRRSISATMKAQGRTEATPAEAAEIRRLVDEQRKIYGSAWLKSLGLHAGEGVADSVQTGHLNSLWEQAHSPDWQKDLTELGVNDGSQHVPGEKVPGALRPGGQPGEGGARPGAAGGAAEPKVGDGVRPEPVLPGGGTDQRGAVPKDDVRDYVERLKKTRADFARVGKKTDAIDEQISEWAQSIKSLPAPQAIALAARLTGVAGLRTRAQAVAAYTKAVGAGGKLKLGSKKPQASSLFDADSHPRETSAHDGKRPGEFAPKGVDSHTPLDTMTPGEETHAEDKKVEPRVYAKAPRTPKNQTDAAKILQDLRDWRLIVDDPASLMPHVDAVGKWVASQKMAPGIRKLQGEAHSLADKLLGGSGKGGIHLNVVAPTDAPAKPKNAKPSNPLPRIDADTEAAMEAAITKAAGSDSVREFIGYSQTEETVPISALSSPQTVMDTAAVDHFLEKPSRIDSTEPLPLVIQYGGKMILRDGNSRTTAAMKLKRDAIKARVVYVPEG